jgi:hypothetical protein
MNVFADMQAYFWTASDVTDVSTDALQVRIKVRRQCSPLDEDHFRPILHHYDGPKFRLQLSVQEVGSQTEYLLPVPWASFSGRGDD